MLKERVVARNAESADSRVCKKTHSGKIISMRLCYVTRTDQTDRTHHRRHCCWHRCCRLPSSSLRRTCSWGRAGFLATWLPTPSEDNTRRRLSLVVRPSYNVSFLVPVGNGELGHILQWRLFHCELQIRNVCFVPWDAKPLWFAHDSIVGFAPGVLSDQTKPGSLFQLVRPVSRDAAVLGLWSGAVQCGACRGFESLSIAQRAGTVLGGHCFHKAFRPQRLCVCTVTLTHLGCSLLQLCVSVKPDRVVRSRGRSGMGSNIAWHRRHNDRFD